MTISMYQHFHSRCAETTLSSKLIGGSHGRFFSEMVVDACLHLEENLDLQMIGIKQVNTDHQLGKEMSICDHQSAYYRAHAIS